jgi:hypothetical protein
MIKREDSAHIVSDCPVSACKIYRIWGSMFLKPEDLMKVFQFELLCALINCISDLFKPNRYNLPKIQLL